MFYENVIIEKEVEEFNRIMRGKYTDIYNMDVFLKWKKINKSLEYSDYTLEIYYSDGVDILVWNKRENKIEFCITENKLSVCKVKIGEFQNKWCMFLWYGSMTREHPYNNYYASWLDIFAGESSSLESYAGTILTTVLMK